MSWHRKERKQIEGTKDNINGSLWGMLQRVVRNIHSAECSRAVISNCLWSTCFTMKNDYVPYEAKYNKSKGF